MTLEEARREEREACVAFLRAQARQKRKLSLRFTGPTRQAILAEAKCLDATACGLLYSSAQPDLGAEEITG